MVIGHNKGWEEAATDFAGQTVKLRVANAALLEFTGEGRGRGRRLSIRTRGGSRASPSTACANPRRVRDGVRRRRRRAYAHACVIVRAGDCPHATAFRFCVFDYVRGGGVGCNNRDFLFDKSQLPTLDVPRAMCVAPCTTTPYSTYLEG